MRLLILFCFTCIHIAVALDPKSLPVKRKSLHVPSLNELAKVLDVGLKSNFEEVSVEVVDCIDLTQNPFNLTSKGLNGNARLVEVGSPGYLLPLVNRSKLYDLKDLARLSDLEDAFIIGAGAGPYPFTGVNCEGVFNLKINRGKVNQQTRTYNVNKDNGLPLETILNENETRLALMGNLFMSNGKPGKVLKVHVKKRLGDMNFVTNIRTILADQYKEKVVGLGGPFLIKEGRVCQHVVRDFSKTPISNDDDVNKWLKLYVMETPLVALGTLITDNYGLDLDLRVEHFHSFGPKHVGGHYHYDVTPEDVEYLGYFLPAEYIYRIDKPNSNQTLGNIV